MSRPRRTILMERQPDGTWRSSALPPLFDYQHTIYVALHPFAPPVREGDMVTLDGNGYARRAMPLYDVVRLHCDANGGCPNTIDVEKTGDVVKVDPRTGWVWDGARRKGYCPAHKAELAQGDIPL